MLDLNMDFLKLLTDLLEIEPEIKLTTDFEKIPETCMNYREKFHPKFQSSDNSGFKHIEYTQVFSDKLGFVPGLSILDLLFNTGPQAYSIMKDGLNYSSYSSYDLKSTDEY